MKKNADVFGKWIPTSERIPEDEEEYVLCSTMWGDIWLEKFETFGHLIVNGEKYYAYYKDRILAWMPAPEPYKKGLINRENNFASCPEKPNESYGKL